MSESSRKGRQFRVSCLVAGTLFAVYMALGVLAVWSANRTRRQAERFLRDFVSLQVGKSTLEDVRRLAKDHDGTESVVSPELAPAGCAPDCRISSFWFESQWLYRLGLGPATAMVATLQTGGGRLIGRAIAIESTSEWDSAVAVDERLLSRSGEPYNVRFRSMRPRWCVEFTPAAPAELRRRAFALNLDCLSRIPGCKTKEQILPEIQWEPAPAKKQEAPRDPDVRP
jgi:hypothetical protein